MSSPLVPKILERIKEIHDKKNADYAQEGNPFSNFERAAILASWFNDPVDKVFATLMGVKLARLAELLNGKTPKNESIDDTFLDDSTYSILWMAYRQGKITFEQAPGHVQESIKESAQILMRNAEKSLYDRS